MLNKSILIKKYEKKFYDFATTVNNNEQPKTSKQTVGELTGNTKQKLGSG